MTKETITYLKRDTTNAAGAALIGKNGNPYTRLSIKVASKGERYISGFENAGNKDWALGQEVEMDITESTTLDKKGQPYLNFTTKKPEASNAEVMQKLETIHNFLVGMKLEINAVRGFVEPKSKVSNYPTNDLDEAFPEDEEEIIDDRPF